MANKRGRKRKSGQRYPSGDLKPAMAPAQWGRIRDVLGQYNPILRTELSRLSFHGELSDTQTQAGFYVGDIYRQFCSRKNPLKAQHGRNSFDRIEPGQPVLFSAQKMSEKEWRTVENEVEALPQKLRNAVLDLCVASEPLNPTLYPEMRHFLDRIARVCGANWRRYPVRELTGPKPRPSTEVASKPSDDDITRQVVERILLTLKPNLKSKELSELTDSFLAIRDRENFRNEKLSGGKALRGFSRRLTTN